MSRTNKSNPKDYNGGGCREYWSNRPHNKGGSAVIGKYQKSRTARTERRLAKAKTGGSDEVLYWLDEAERLCASVKRRK